MSELKKLEKDLEPDFQEIVKGSAQLIRGEAIKSIQTGAKTGIVYQKYNPRRQHRASAPGQAPAIHVGVATVAGAGGAQDQSRCGQQAAPHDCPVGEGGPRNQEQQEEEIWS